MSPRHHRSSVAPRASAWRSTASRATRLACTSAMMAIRISRPWYAGLEVSARMYYTEMSDTEAGRKAAFIIDAQPPVAWGTRTFTTEAAAALWGALEERGLGGVPPLAALPRPGRPGPGAAQPRV